MSKVMNIVSWIFPLYVVGILLHGAMINWQVERKLRRDFEQRHPYAAKYW